MNDPPESLLIRPDKYHIRHVGRAGDGRQFFLTTPFVPAYPGEEGREFIALYLFDSAGDLVEARIDDLGPRATMDEAQASEIHAQRLPEVAPAKIGHTA